MIKNEGYCAWMEKIPQSLKDAIKHRDTLETIGNVMATAGIIGEDLDDFPFTHVKKLFYSPILINAYTQYAAWQIIESKDLIEEFMAREYMSSIIIFFRACKRILFRPFF